MVVDTFFVVVLVTVLCPVTVLVGFNVDMTVVDFVTVLPAAVTVVVAVVSWLRVIVTVPPGRTVVTVRVVT